MCRLATSLTSTTFFFNHTATTEIYTLSLHDALPIFRRHRGDRAGRRVRAPQLLHDDAGGRDERLAVARDHGCRDRKSTRLNSSHGSISYAVFCLKKKKRKQHKDTAHGK